MLGAAPRRRAAADRLLPHIKSGSAFVAGAALWSARALAPPLRLGLPRQSPQLPFKAG
jgi:hypothetical protein